MDYKPYRNEQFETARHTMLAPELTVLRHGLKAPLSKLKTAIDELQKTKQSWKAIWGAAMDRAELRNHSLQCGDLLQQAHNQVTQAITMVDAIQQQDRSLDMGEKSHFLVAPLLQACTQEIKPTGLALAAPTLPALSAGSRPLQLSQCPPADHQQLAEQLPAPCLPGRPAR